MKPAQTSDQAAPRAVGSNAIIVENERLFRELLRHTCEAELNLHVVGEAANGHDAIDLIRTQRPELVMLDPSLPDMTGLDVIQATRSVLPKPHFLAVGIGNDPFLLRAFERQGFDGYVDRIAATMEVLKDAVAALNEGGGYWERLRKLLAQRKADPTFKIDRVLTRRQLQVLHLIGYSLSDVDIGTRLGLASSTIQSHRRDLMRKLDLNDTPQLIHFALKHGITPSPPCVLALEEWETVNQG